MSVTPVRSSLGVRQTSAGRLEFHLRLPDVTPENPARAAPRPDSVELPRGMQVLHRILDDGARPAPGRRAWLPARNPLRYVSLLLLGISCLAVAYALTGRDTVVKETAAPEIFDDEFGDLDPKGAEEPRVAAASRGGDERRQEAVLTADYQTTSAAPGPRLVWLDGTILPDEPSTPADGQGR